MFDEDRLGRPDGFTKAKGFYLLYIIAFFAILFYGLLGAAEPSKNVIWFYIAFTGLLGFLPLVIDNLAKNREKLDEIDTVAVEEPPSRFFSYKNQIIIAVAVCLIFVFRVSTTGTVWVQAPSLAIEQGAFDSKIGNAFLAGFIGIGENLVFFGVIAATIYAFAFKRTSSGILATLAYFIGGIAVFVFYHTIRYGNNESALFAVGSFAFINLLSVYLTRSLMISDALHFTNNFVATAFSINKIGFGIVT